MKIELNKDYSELILVGVVAFGFLTGFLAAVGIWWLIKANFPELTATARWLITAPVIATYFYLAGKVIEVFYNLMFEDVAESLSEPTPEFVGPEHEN